MSPEKLDLFELETKTRSEAMSRCANCGVAESDGGAKLKSCSACHLVKYCGVKCQKEHRPKHKQECKKRAAELKDEILFRQPESSHLGDCPICFLPMPLDATSNILSYCCSHYICHGCHGANLKREWTENLERKCPFCRTPLPESLAQSEARIKSRAEQMKDPVAMREMASRFLRDGDVDRAFHYHSKALEMGDVSSYFELGCMYHHGKGVEKDESKAVSLYEKAAIAGHTKARHNLGGIEAENGRTERAVRHWIIAAKLGEDRSLENLKSAYQQRLVGKDDFESALRGHKDAIDAMKSPQREVADRELSRFLSERESSAKI